MKKLVLNQRIEQEHLAYFNDIIVPKFQTPPQLIVQNKQPLVDQLFVLFIEHQRELAIGSPAKLRQIANKIKLLGEQLLLEKVKEDEVPKSLNQYLADLFGYEKFSATPQNVSKETIRLDNFNDIKTSLFEKWTAYKLVYESGIRVCPYCNRQYITPIYIRETSQGSGHCLRADLDHFYPKAHYPYLSMSLYNLVPCCKFCNTSLKGDKKISFDDINPYESSLADHFSFAYNEITGAVQIKTIDSDQHKINNLLNIFQTEALYSYHGNIAEDMLKKREIYPDSHIQELFDNHKSLFGQKEDVVQLIFGNSFDQGTLNDEVLVKFKNDLVCQFNIH